MCFDRHSAPLSFLFLASLEGTHDSALACQNQNSHFCGFYFSNVSLIFFAVIFFTDDDTFSTAFDIFGAPLSVLEPSRSDNYDSDSQSGS